MAIMSSAVRLPRTHAELPYCTRYVTGLIVVASLRGNGPPRHCMAEGTILFFIRSIRMVVPLWVQIPRRCR